MAPKRPSAGAAGCGAGRRPVVALLSGAAVDLSTVPLDIQPSRINSAMPWASLRSVFTGMILNALRTCRVSNSSTTSPASRMPA
jgi:hypothetical protein